MLVIFNIVYSKCLHYMKYHTLYMCFICVHLVVSRGRGDSLQSMSMAQCDMLEKQLKTALEAVEIRKVVILIKHRVHIIFDF